MELRHLRYFIAAAEEEHFGRASDRLHVTRPAVSQILADLEGELGTLLFERLPHRVRLTAAGRALLPRLQAIMRSLDEALTMTKRVGEGKSGALSIGYGSLALLHSVFRAAIKQFHESHPDVALSLVEMPTSQQPKALAEGKIHAGFMHFGPQPAFMRHKRTDRVLAEDPTVLDWVQIEAGDLGIVVPSDHRLARRKAVSFDELAQENFVVVPQSSATPGWTVTLYALCEKAGFTPHVVQQVSSVASQLNLISVGIGIGLAVVGKNFSYPAGVSVVPLKDVGYSTSFIFAWTKGHKDPALDRMVDVIHALTKRR